YGLASAHTSYTWEPPMAALRDPFESDLAVTLADWRDAEVRATVERVYREYAAPRNLAIDRSAEWWRTHTWAWGFEQKEERRIYLAVARDPRGRARGYVAYRTKEDHVSFEPGP